jgi:endonuclease III
MIDSKRILSTLDLMFPDAHVELNHHNHFELLVAVVLSAQTTDISVNKVTPGLFKAYPTPEKMMHADVKDIESHIQSIGLFHNKAKHIQMLSKDIVEKHQGVVPSSRVELEALPGVGRKTANVVLSNAFGIPALAVDTHVARVSVRLGLAQESDDVITIENKLMNHFPENTWTKLHHQLIFFGRYHCLAKQPKCEECPLFDICTYPKKHQNRNI